MGWCRNRCQKMSQVAKLFVTALVAGTSAMPAILAFFVVLEASGQFSPPAVNAVFCRQVALEIRDLRGFGQAMTEGMLLQAGQADLFEVYRKIFFGNPNTYVNNETLNSVTDMLAQHPELQKPHFREYEISHVEKVYETPLSLAKYLKSQVQTAAEVRNSLLQIEANIGFWKKILDYQDPQWPEALEQMQNKLNRESSASEKEAYRAAKSAFEVGVKKRFETYLNRIISKANRDLLAELKNDDGDYQKKVQSLFATLKYIQEWMGSKGRNTQAIRQAMVDLVHTVGFGNQATQILLKSKNAMDRIEGLKKILDERDAVAMNLGFAGHFQELQTVLNIEFPTGLSKNETPSQNIQRIEEEVLAGRFTTKPTETIRVRSLSIQEAPFRSCLGGSDCSTATYFSKALDPNFNYFTMTESNLSSSGQVTVVLGEAKNPRTGQLEKVAFLDKLQNVPNPKIPSFLQAVAMSLAERGYKLGLPEEVGDHNGISNMDTIRHFVTNEIAPRLSQKLIGFVPHPHQYDFENKYSRAYDKLDVKVYVPGLIETNSVIRPGREYISFVASQDLDKKRLVKELLSLKNSSDPAEVLTYVSSGQVVSQLEILNLLSVKEFEKDLLKIIERKDLPFNVRKQAVLEMLLINSKQSQNELNQKMRLGFRSFDETEKIQISSEIRQWSKTSNKRKKNFAESLKERWAEALAKSDIYSLDVFVALRLFDINARDESGFSILHRAIFRDQKAVIEWLIVNPNLDLSQRDDLGFTDVEQARLMGKNEVADWIEKARPESKSRKLKVKERNSARSFRYFRGTPIVDFVKIREGKFLMGDPEKTTGAVPVTSSFAASVTITKSFEILSTLTTQKMWEDIVTLANTYFKGKYSLKPAPSYFGGEMNPVEQVSYFDVVAWIKAANELSKLSDPRVQKALSEVFPGHEKNDVYGLPTEAQWEFVARKRGLSIGNDGNDRLEQSGLDYAWHTGNSGAKTHPVGLKRPMMMDGNPIYDFHGNVEQWVADWYEDNTLGGVDPQGPSKGIHRVLRGGSWNNLPSDLHSGHRGYRRPEAVSKEVGFRLVRTRPSY